MKLNKAIGKMPCLCCGETITVKQADTGTLSLSCPDCDFSGYARAGTEAHRRTMKRITLRPDAAAPVPVPAPAPAPARPAPAKPAPTMADLPATKRNTLFG